MHNFEYLQIFEGIKSRKIKLQGTNKGQKEELEAFVQSLIKGEAMPIAVQDLLDTTLLTLCAWEAAISGETVKLA